MVTYKQFVEDFNIFPRARAINGRPMPSPGPNINFSGPLPVGFKGAGVPGIAPGAEQPVIIRLPKKKKKLLNTSKKRMMA